MVYIKKEESVAQSSNNYSGFQKIKSSLRFTLILLIIIGGVLGVAFSIQAYPELLRSSVSLEKDSEIGPDEALILDFSQPVSPQNYQSPIEIYPKEEVALEWMNDGQRMKITPKNFWKPETKYLLVVPEGRNKFFGQIKRTEFEWNTVAYPRVKNFQPADGTKDVILDMEDPITVDFDKSTKGFFIKFTVNPFSNMIYENNPEKTQFRLLTKDKVQDGVRYAIEVYVKHIKDTDDNYRKIYSGQFETLPPAPVTWEKDLGLRLEQAKKFTRPKIMTGKYIDVNLATQIMSIFQDGQLLDAYIISSGKRGMETPKGEHQIYNKRPRAWSKQYGLFMPYWMAILSDGKVGIHELPEWPGGYKEGASHLGTPVSHGCIRLGVGSAQRVFDWADIGTKVIVY